MLTKTFYMNTILEWLIAFGIMLLFIILGKIIYRFTTNVLKKLAKKSQTKLDDILIDIVEEPLVTVFVVVGIWVSLGSLKC